MTHPRRDVPLTATHPAVEPSAAEVGDERGGRFADDVRQLRVGRATVRLEERILLVLGGIVAPLGLVVVLLGWWGASHTPYVFEQVPYLVSGGLFGLGLVFLGAFFYFAHWMTQLVKEHRTQSEAILGALARLQEQLATPLATSTNGHIPTSGPAAPAGPGAAGAGLLVSTSRGTMAHRPECVVVAGKQDLRVVEAGAELAACKLCDPYALGPPPG